MPTQGSALRHAFGAMVVLMLCLTLVGCEAALAKQEAQRRQQAQPYLAACVAAMAANTAPQSVANVPVGKPLLVQGEVASAPIPGVVVIMGSAASGQDPHSGKVDFWKGAPNKNETPGYVICMRQNYHRVQQWSDGSASGYYQLDVWVLDWPGGDLVAQLSWRGETSKHGVQPGSPIDDAKDWLAAR